MSLYLNQRNDLCVSYSNDLIFIDNLLLIKETNDAFDSDYFLCVSQHLRRFGKTMALSMLNAYYSKG